MAKRRLPTLGVFHVLGPLVSMLCRELLAQVTAAVAGRVGTRSTVLQQQLDGEEPGAGPESSAASADTTAGLSRRSSSSGSTLSAVMEDADDLGEDVQMEEAEAAAGGAARGGGAAGPAAAAPAAAASMFEGLSDSQAAA